MTAKHSIPHNLLPYVREKLLTKITVLPSGCWIYNGYTGKDGYAEWRPYPLAPIQYVHRSAYEAFKGPIPDGQEPDHLCRRRNCCNPEHLEAVTHLENIMRSPTQPAAINARKTHCKRGHEFTPENTYPNGRDKKGRGCVACRDMRNAKLI